jgi:AcrR family transcriptional regulator
MDDVDDPLRERLLDAARNVFARQGYEGTRIGDIVREAGLSTGAVYGRFRSKNELLRAAVVGHASVAQGTGADVNRVADLIARGARWSDASLTLDEAVRLEAHVAARREPEVAQALHDAHARWRDSVEPLVQRALVDGTVADGVDPEAVLAFVRTMSLGLLVQRAAGTKAPDARGWEDLVDRLVASLGERVPGTASTPPISTATNRSATTRSATTSTSPTDPVATHTATTDMSPMGSAPGGDAEPQPGGTR